MPNTSDIQPFNATCGGGLVLNKDVYDMQPGEAEVVQFLMVVQVGHGHHLQLV